MERCKIILKLSDGTEKEFNSDAELDGWLFTHRGTIEIGSNGDIQYSTAPIDITRANLNEATRYRAVIDTSINQGNVIGSFGKAVATSYSAIKGLMGDRSDNGLFLKKIVSYPHTEDPLANVRKKMGYAFESVMQFCIEQALGKPLTPPNYHGLDEDRRKLLLEKCTEIASKIVGEHGKNAEYKFQVKIAAKSLSTKFEASLRMTSGINPQGGNYSETNSFIGDIDLVVIDEKGVAHIYDFKSSEGTVTVQENAGYACQIAAYAQMLRQWGVQVGNVGLIPIQVKYLPKDKQKAANGVGNVVGFETPSSWRSTLYSANPYVSLVKEWFPTDKHIAHTDLKDLGVVMNVVAPTSGQDQTIQFRNKEIELECKRVFNVREDHPKYREGYRLQYERKGLLKPGEERYIYGKTMEDLRPKIEQWVGDYNERRGEACQKLGESLKGIVEKGSERNLHELSLEYTGRNSEYIVKVFTPYISGKWNLVSDDLMLANGIFLFQSGDRYELVMVDTHNPYAEIDWDHGNTRRNYTSILGAFMADDEEGIDERWVLHNFYGNMSMLKGLIFMGLHPEYFKNGCMLNRVCTMSLFHDAIMEESNEKLAENYRLIVEEYNKKTGKNLNLLSINHEIVNDSAAYVHRALDYLSTYTDPVTGYSFKDYKEAFEGMEKLSEYKIEQVKKMIDTLRWSNGSGLTKLDNISWNENKDKALYYLYRAWLSLKGYQVSAEPRIGNYMNNGPAFNGIYARSFADSKSAIARTLHEAVYSFTRVCQDNFVKETAEWKKTIQKLYEESEHDKFWGGEYNFFEKFFEHNGDKLSIEFKLKPKGSMRTETENKVLELFYNALDRYQYGKGFDDRAEEKISEAITNGTYGQVPLIKSHLTEKLGKMNPLKAVLEDCKTNWGVMRDFLLNVDVSESRVKELDNIDLQRIPALVFEMSEREERLNKNGTDNYTTDLDFVYNMIVAQGIKYQRSPDLLITTAAIRSALLYMVKQQGVTAENKVDLTNQVKAIEAYVKRKVFNRPITDPGSDNIKKLINVVKSLTSFTTLGANFRGFTRETLTGIEKAFFDVTLHPKLKQYIGDTKYYVEALTEIIRDCYKNTDVLSWHMQLNAIYGTANFSYDQMAEASKVNQYGIKNLAASDLYFTTTWPDFIHRNAIVIAYLKRIGAYEAYSLVDGILTYDMDKDPRFELLRKYKTEKDCPLSEIASWRAAERLYMDEFNSWKLNGYYTINPETGEPVPFNVGDKLPQALCPRVVLGLKDIADEMYGNYDKETKSLMADTLLGSLFLQFKTYGINRLQELLDTGTSTSMIFMTTEKIKNANGELEDAYLVFSNDADAVMRGDIPAWSLVPASEVTPEMLKEGRAVLARHASSYYNIGGQINTLIDIGASLFLYKNQDEFARMWNSNPQYKANVYLFMIDTFGMLLLAFIINMVYGNVMQGDYDEINWLTKWSYNVAMGVVQDGPVWSVVSSVASGGAPPMVSILQNYANNAWSVMTGKHNFLYGLSNTFGATRELAYLFDIR